MALPKRDERHLVATGLLYLAKGRVTRRATIEICLLIV